MDSIILFTALTTLKNLRKKVGTQNSNVDKSLAGSMVVLTENLLDNLKRESGGMSLDLNEREQQYVKAGPNYKISALKAYRERTGAGLADAKHAVEKWGRENGYYDITNSWNSSIYPGSPPV